VLDHEAHLHLLTIVTDAGLHDILELASLEVNHHDEWPFGVVGLGEGLVGDVGGGLFDDALATTVARLARRRR
jgi:hypothetical protein